MPGPPPPSKSYNLVLDTDSEDEEDDYYQHRSIRTSRLNANVTASKNTNTNVNGNGNGNETDSNESSTPLEIKTISPPSPSPPSSPPAVTTSSASKEVNNPLESTAAAVELTSNHKETVTVASVSKKESIREREPPILVKESSTTQPTLPTITTTTSSNPTNSKPNHKEETTTTTNSTAQEPTTTNKKKKKKKKRRKKKAKTTNTATTTTTRLVVSFSSELTISEYPRRMGGEGVPLDGGWPLAMEHTASQSRVVDILEYERLKQVELRERYETYVMRRRQQFIGTRSSSGSSSNGGGGGGGGGGSSSTGGGGGHCKKSGRHRSKSHGNARDMQTGRHRSKSHGNTRDMQTNSTRSTSCNAQQQEGGECSKEYLEKKRIETVPIHLPPESYRFETRQLDHKRKLKNHTHALFNITHAVDNPDKESHDEWNEIQELGVNVVFGPMNEDKRKEVLLQASNSSSSTSTTSSSPNRKTRSKTKAKELYSDTEIRHVRNELEQIRIQRSEENCAGCSCRKLHVTLPNNKNQSKKNHHRRLTERKVKEELRKRHVHYDNNQSRNELEVMLHDIVEKEGCCFGMDCPCVRNEINCQADTCSCWKISHSTGNHKDDHKDNEASIQDMQSCCGNEYGMYVYDSKQIAENRQRYINAVANQICGIVSASAI